MNNLSHIYLSNNSEFVHHEDTYELFKGLDLNNNGNIEPIEIDDSLKGKKKSSISLFHLLYKLLLKLTYIVLSTNVNLKI